MDDLLSNTTVMAMPPTERAFEEELDEMVRWAFG